MTFANDTLSAETALESAIPAVSWGAIAAGATANVALTLVLLSLGAGLGFSIVSPWGGVGVSATTFKLGVGVYLLVVAMISSAIGGHIAGRLRTKWTGVHADEVFFRDTAHGFLAWAFAAVVGVVLLAAPAGVIARGVASGASQGATQTASASPADGYVDLLLLRTDGAAPADRADVASTRAELVRVFAAGARNGGDLVAPDRAYVAKVVAARAGLSETDAARRVDDVVTQAKGDADRARKAAAQLSLWLTASLVLGAFASSLAASEGGRVRDTDRTARR